MLNKEKIFYSIFDWKNIIYYSINKRNNFSKNWLVPNFRQNSWQISNLISSFTTDTKNWSNFHIMYICRTLYRHFCSISFFQKYPLNIKFVSTVFMKGLTFFKKDKIWRRQCWGEFLTRIAKNSIKYKN